MEVIIKTKPTETDKFGELYVHNIYDTSGYNSAFKFRRMMFTDEGGSPVYVLKLEVKYSEFNKQTGQYDNKSYVDTFFETRADCENEDEYLEWLHNNIEFILVNGTFYFQSDDAGGEDDTIDDSTLSQNIDLATMLSS